MKAGEPIIERKLIFVVGQQAFVPQFAQFSRHGAAVHGEVVGQLLPVVWNQKMIAAGRFRLFRKIGQQLFSRVVRLTR